MNDDYYGNAKKDAEYASWDKGGIFGTAVKDIDETLEEIEDGPFPDGNGGFRERMGYGNVLGSEDAVRIRRAKAAERDSMLLAERFIDELPDLRNKVFDSVFGEDGLRGKLIERIQRGRPYVSDDGFDQPTDDSVAGALGERLKQTTFDVTAEIFRRAYASDINRAHSAVRLGAFDPEQWARMQALKVLGAPSAVVARAQKFAARVKHVVKAVSEPLNQPGAEAHDDHD